MTKDELLARAEQIIRAVQDEEICMCDHHGDCQEHYGSVEIEPGIHVCVQKVISNWLQALKEES